MLMLMPMPMPMPMLVLVRTAHPTSQPLVPISERYPGWGRAFFIGSFLPAQAT
ncbi:hypothetical protein ACX0MV_05550 [Pseudomonas borbori]